MANRVYGITNQDSAGSTYLNHGAQLLAQIALQVCKCACFLCCVIVLLRKALALVDILGVNLLTLKNKRLHLFCGHGTFIPLLCDLLWVGVVNLAVEEFVALCFAQVLKEEIALVNLQLQRVVYDFGESQARDIIALCNGHNRLNRVLFVLFGHQRVGDFLFHVSGEFVLHVSGVLANLAHDALANFRDFFSYCLVLLCKLSSDFVNLVFQRGDIVFCGIRF